MSAFDCVLLGLLLVTLVVDVRALTELRRIHGVRAVMMERLLDSLERKIDELHERLAVLQERRVTDAQRKRDS